MARTPLAGGVDKPRLRYFENASGQQHIPEQDKYLYAIEAPRYKLAIIGTGTIGQEHMRVAKLLGRAAVHGIYDQSALSVDVALANFEALDAGSSPAKKARPPIVYDSLEAACQDAAIDALMICTPNYTHFDVVKMAMTSGKPIFLEKPIATTLADAAAIVELARSYSGFIQLGLQYRYKAQYVEALHEIKVRGSLGATQTISLSEYRPPFLDKVGQWNKFNALSGGTLVEKCCHYFDLINLIADARPSRVYASAGRSGVFDGVVRDNIVSDIDDNAFVVIDYANGARANFALNMNAPDFTEELCVVGDRGRLTTCERFQQNHGQQASASISLQLGEQGASRETSVGYASAIEASGHHGATYYEHAAFLDRIEARGVGKTETNAAATPEQGLWSMLVASAAQESSRTGEAVNIDAYCAANGLDSLLK